MHTTPLVVWSNFGLQNGKEPVGLSLLSSRILRKIGIPLSPYQSFLAKLSDRIRTVSDFHALPTDEDSKKLIHDYRILQYAIITGDLNPSPLIAAHDGE